MARIYKRTDRITVKINDVELKLAPLSLDQKTEIQQILVEAQRAADVKGLTRGIVLAIKYSLKDVKGLEGSDGPYKLQFDEAGLADECIEDLMNVDFSKKLTMVCSAMVNGVPTQFTDDRLKPLEGVEIVSDSKASDDNLKNA